MIDDDRAARIDRRLTELKDAIGLSWDHLAEHAGISSSGLRRIRHGDVVPREITRRGLAYVLRVDQTEIDDLFGVDGTTTESDGVTWADLALARPDVVFRHHLVGSGKTSGVITALLVDLPRRLLAELTDEEIVSVQAKLTDYADYLAKQTIQDRGKL